MSFSSEFTAKPPRVFMSFSSEFPAKPPCVSLSKVLTDTLYPTSPSAAFVGPGACGRPQGSGAGGACAHALCGQGAPYSRRVVFRKIRQILPNSLK